MFLMQGIGDIIVRAKTIYNGVHLFRNEIIYDSQNEWNYRDSAGYSQPGLNSNGDFALPYYLKTKLSINSFRINGYIQNSQTLSKNYNAILTYGLRSNWWSFNNENVISPRVQFSFEPNRLYNRNIVTQKLEKENSKRLGNKGCLWLVLSTTFL
jgi:hypothetical protein